VARILVVDDDPDVLKLVEKVLSTRQHEVFVASDAIKAMDMMNSSSFDLLISDGNMPHFSGFELVSTIKNNKRLQKMAVAMLTGMRERKDIEKAIRAGVDDYIVKPIEPFLLIQKVEAIFAKKPPTRHSECDVPENFKMSASKLVLDTRVIRISEIGLVIKTPFTLADGTLIDVPLEIFRRLDLKPPQMKVIGSHRIDENNFEIRIGFVAVNDNFTTTLRRWIDKNLNPNRGAA
jgi:DNA-binding response OmpR family regulator